LSVFSRDLGVKLYECFSVFGNKISWDDWSIIDYIYGLME